MHRPRLRHSALTSWLAVSLTVVLAAGCNKDAAPKDAAASAPPEAARAAASGGRAALTVTVTQARASTWAQIVSANGSVAAWEEALVGAESGGLRITAVMVNVGDRVRRGQPLAQLTSATAVADTAATSAAVAEAEAALAEARSNADRARQLRDNGFLSPQGVIQATTAEATALARVEAQRARLRADQVRLGQTRIVAPDDGVISARSATVGAVVQSGQELFRLIRGGRLEWRAEVTSADLPRVAVGQRVSLTLGDGSTVNGSVRMVAPTVDPVSRNGLVYVDLPQPGAARAGMFARGELAVAQTPALTLPQAAVALRDGFSFVYRVDAGSRVTQVPVRTGRRVGDRVEIVSGIDAPDRVVAAGVGFLSDGDRVRVVEAAPAAASAAPAAAPAAASARP